MTGHYRQPVDWNDEVVAESRKKLDRLYGALRELADVEPAPGVTAPDAFIAALEDDINTPMARSEEHTSELQSLMRISYAVFCLKKKKRKRQQTKQLTLSRRQHHNKTQ